MANQFYLRLGFTERIDITDNGAAMLDNDPLLKLFMAKNPVSWIDSKDTPMIIFELARFALRSPTARSTLAKPAGNVNVYAQFPVVRTYGDIEKLADGLTIISKLGKPLVGPVAAVLNIVRTRTSIAGWINN